MEDYLFIEDSGIAHRVLFSEILYIKSNPSSIIVVTTKGNFSTQYSLETILQDLPGDSFFQIHRSYIISLKQVKWFNDKHVVVGTRKIPIGKEFKDVLKNGAYVVDGDEPVEGMTKLTRFDIKKLTGGIGLN
jgi:DNA-binding LytR/AlgR family response regulator